MREMLYFACFKWLRNWPVRDVQPSRRGSSFVDITQPLPWREMAARPIGASNSLGQIADIGLMFRFCKRQGQSRPNDASPASKAMSGDSPRPPELSDNPWSWHPHL